VALNVSDSVQKIRAIQASMVDAAESCFEPSELEHLRVLVRLTMEFRQYLQRESVEMADIHYSNQYVSESIFSGLDSFRSVTHAYQVLVGARDSAIDWSVISKSSIEREFLSTFESLEQAQIFEDKCRFLWDLFKLQLAFAAILYD
jgi:hypothetical protein